ncbi:MAG: FecR family protein, partial [Planctomycetota bacterium]
LADTGAGTLGAHSDLSVRSAHALALAHGVLTLDLAPRGADSPFTLDTPHASCRVIGTRFTVRCDDLGSAVEVAAGSVQWQSDDAPAQTVRAGQSASAGAEILFGYDFTGGTVRQIGTFPTPVPLDSRDGLRFAEGGLLLTRNDFTAVHNPPQPDVFIDRLRAADAVSLSARVRFLTAIPRNVSIATLLSMAPEQPDRRFFPLRWLAAGVPAGRRWYDVRVTLSRDGHQRWYIDGQLVEQMARGWIFADWADSLALRIHTHQDLPEEPVDIVYARLRVIVH